MSDAADIVSGGAAEAPKSELQKILEEKSSAKVVADVVESNDRNKLRGLHRELYNLVGGRAPLAESAGYSPSKAKAKLAKAATRWEWRPFKNAARKDGLQLNHWVKKDDAATEYPFAKFNKPSRVQTFTRDEYLRLLTDDDWTEGETTLLFEMCRRFDLRFIVVHDQFILRTPRPEKKRSVEDLKARYYSIWTKIAVAREEIKRLHAPKKDGARNHVEFTYRYDAAHETKRKEQLIRLSKRTFAQMHEEVLLSNELKRIQQQKRDREGIVGPLPTSGGGGGGSSTKARRASQSSVADDGGHRSKKHASVEKVKASASAAKAMSAIRPAQPHVTHLRSAIVHRALALKPKLAQQVSDVLSEMGIAEFPMPTKNVEDAYENVRGTVLELLQLEASIEQLQKTMNAKKS